MSGLGTSLPVFVGLTIVLVGGAAVLTGQALARNWRPITHVVVASALLGAADRFLVFALFEGTLWTLWGYLVDTFVIMLMALIAYRITQARRMVQQYPWLYERTGLFTWRARREISEKS